MTQWVRMFKGLENKNRLFYFWCEFSKKDPTQALIQFFKPSTLEMHTWGCPPQERVLSSKLQHLMVFASLQSAQHGEPACVHDTPSHESQWILVILGVSAFSKAQYSFNLMTCSARLMLFLVDVLFRVKSPRQDNGAVCNWAAFISVGWVGVLFITM